MLPVSLSTGSPREGQVAMVVQNRATGMGDSGLEAETQVTQPNAGTAIGAGIDVGVSGTSQATNTAGGSGDQSALLGDGGRSDVMTMRSATVNQLPSDISRSSATSREQDSLDLVQRLRLDPSPGQQPLTPEQVQARLVQAMQAMQRGVAQ